MVHSTRGYLQVLGEDHRSLGFVGKEYNKYGEYGVLTNDPADYLLVSMHMDKASSQNGVVSTVVSAYIVLHFPSLSMNHLAWLERTTCGIPVLWRYWWIQLNVERSGDGQL